MKNYIKNMIVKQVKRRMKDQNITKAELARRMGTSRATVYRLLDPKNRGVTLKVLVRAANAVGGHILISFEKKG